jgi:Asp-tRNA(Asn)/Glu-tRNA(Gln) amidotransferase A subunit family amidase
MGSHTAGSGFLVNSHKVETRRHYSVASTRHAGIDNAPESIPGAEVDSLPVGLSIVGGPGTDGTLVAVAAVFTRK